MCDRLSSDRLAASGWLLTCTFSHTSHTSPSSLLGSAEKLNPGGGQFGRKEFGIRKNKGTTDMFLILYKNYIKRKCTIFDMILPKSLHFLNNKKASNHYCVKNLNLFSKPLLDPTFSSHIDKVQNRVYSDLAPDFAT